MGDLVIGIDLGTTNSCVAIFMNKKLKILEYKSGGRIIPSFICFQPDGIVVIGEHAKNMAVHEPKNGIYEMKRLVGRKFDDPLLQKSLEYFPFTVSADFLNNPVVSFKQKGATVRKTPKELYTILLKELKHYTEEKLGETVKKVVITVPAYFNVTQREATLAAAEDAGFTVLKLLNEPTAAALTYYYDQDIEETHRSLVYDLGGGTFDVAILEKRFDNVDVVCVAGDTQLGGHDLDNCILEYVYQQLRDKYDYDPQCDSDDKRRLRHKCEKAKKELSDANEAVITINGMVPNHPKIKITLKRKEFESMADELFKRTIDILDNCLKDSKFSKSSIQEVILCGGSTRIPKIQELVSDYFGGKQLNKFPNPDECVAEGAALQAAMLSTSKRQTIEELKMVDVVPLSIGFDSLGDKMIFTIKRGSKLPASASHTYVNLDGNDTSFSIGIYEGERLDVKKNRHLGTITINNVTPAPPGQREVMFTLAIDLNGILTAKAKEKLCDNVKELKVEYTRGSISDREIKNSILAAAENKINDEKFEQFVKHKQYLIKYCIAVTYALEEQELTDVYEEMYNFCKETRWTADVLEMDEEIRVKELIQKCKRLCDKVVQSRQFQFMPQEV
ncbi:hypothetical protein Zmor_011506 [Zophobas morio]|uniref:Uncharacterized protein n=1 Tax=Zophobas morio TaxID=2755281 RepID=A0AA38MJK2_9CUCU|nr:hypothetical protein Zmor_011506 [Zophobas morio]